MDDNLKKILPYALNYKKNIVWNVIFNILYALFGTVGMVFIFPVLKVLFGNTEKVTQLPTYNGLATIDTYLYDTLFYYVTYYSETYGANYALLLTVSLVIVTFLLKNLSGYLGLQHLMKLKTGVLRDFRRKMYAKIVELPVSYYSEKRKGDVMARMLGDVNEVQNSFFLVLELIVKEPLTIIFSLIAMIKIRWELTLFVFIFIPISGFIISKIGKSLKSQSTRAQQENGYLISITEETLSGLGIITIGFLLIYGSNSVLVEKSLDVALFHASITSAYNILTPAKAISKATYQVKNGMAAAERVFEIIDTPNVIRDTEHSKVIETFNNNISLKNVTFSYDGEREVLKNFNLEIPKGKMVALVGQSGSGKSTIANLLMRFYDVEHGEILIDNINIKNIQLISLRDQLGLVTQDSIMFNGTIADNVKIGKQNATDNEVIEALRIANAYEFVQNLPQGIHTNIGDAGGKLSGGQKQRISIARAVLKNPPIMVLDEATSALDTESERLVQDALEKMMENRTSVVIAHRLSTIQKADMIVVMHHGEIAEQGTHDELLAKNGTYAKLVSLQSFEN